MFCCISIAWLLFGDPVAQRHSAILQQTRDPSKAIGLHVYYVSCTNTPTMLRCSVELLIDTKKQKAHRSDYNMPSEQAVSKDCLAKFK